MHGYASLWLVRDLRLIPPPENPCTVGQGPQRPSLDSWRPVMRPTDKRSIISVECAVRRYANTIRQGSSPCRADRNAEGQAANYREAVERAELRAEQVRQVIMTHGVSLIQFMTYRNFGLHVDKLFRDYSGESLRLRVLDAVERWKCYGCKADIIAEICQRVFALDINREP
jgi:hypothetical protein